MTNSSFVYVSAEGNETENTNELDQITIHKEGHEQFWEIALIEGYGGAANRQMAEMVTQTGTTTKSPTVEMAVATSGALCRLQKAFFHKAKCLYNRASRPDEQPSSSVQAHTPGRCKESYTHAIIDPGDDRDEYRYGSVL